MKTFRRVLTILLTISLMLSLLSVAAFADGEEHTHDQTVCADCGGTGHASAECAACGGTGAVAGDVNCGTCGGSGMKKTYVTCDNCGGDGEMDDKSYCPVCGGWGDVAVEEKCPDCGGAGTVAGSVTCPDCTGKGSVETEESCPTCGGSGKTDCSGSFDSGVLTAISSESKGTVTYSCADCGASYTEELSAEATAAKLASGLTMTLVPTAFAGRKQTVTYTLTVTNTNAFNVSGISLSAALDAGIAYTSASFSGTYRSGTSYRTASCTANSAKDALTVTVPGIKAGAYLTVKINAKIAEEAELGSDLFVKVGGTVAPSTALAEISASTHVNKYMSAANIYLAGSKMGGWYNASGSTATARSTVKNAGASLESFEGRVFSFDEVFNSEKYADTGVIKYSTDAAYYGQTVSNPNDSLTWQCVGFVPYKGYSGNGDISTVKSYVYTETPESTGFTKGTLAEAQKYVADNGGILYGETAGEDFIKALESKIYSNSVTVMCVWFVSPVKPLEKHEYGELAISSVPAVDYQKTSDGVTVACGEVTNTGNSRFDAEIIVTIGQNAPDSININLNDALGEAMDKIMALAGHNEIQPGDTLSYHITVNDNSGRSYSFSAGSTAVGTMPMSGEGSLGTGFEGYNISAASVKSYIPRRVLNKALMELGAKSDISDGAIGGLLAKMGYGEGEGLSDEEITQKYLGVYYLDYFNKTAGDEPTTSFQNLSDNQLRLLTDSLSNGVEESCPDVAEALYYFYYGRAYTFNGVSLYGRMADRTELDSLFGAAVAAGESFELSTALDGHLMTNAFQLTKFAFGMQFSMTARPAVPPVTPPPEEPEPTPDDPDIDIPDEDTPLAPGPVDDVPEDKPSDDGFVDIPDEDTPLAGLPQTGDSNGLIMSVIGAAASLAGLIYLVLSSGKKKKADR